MLKVQIKTEDSSYRLQEILSKLSVPNLVDFVLRTVIRLDSTIYSRLAP